MSGAELVREKPLAQALPRLGINMLLPWILLAAVPVIFAIASWDVDKGRSSLQSGIRFYALPAMVAEIVLIIFAFARGFSPVRVVRSLSPWKQAALAVLVATGFGTAVFAAPEPASALVRTCISLIHLSFGLGCLYLLRLDGAAVRPTLWPAIVIGLCGYAVAVAALVWSIPDPLNFDWLYFGLGMVNIRQMAFYSAAGAAAALGLAAAASNRRAYLSYVAAAGILLALSFWSGTRGGIVALLVAFGAGAVLLPALRRLSALVALASGILLGVLLSLIHVPPSGYYGLVRIARSGGDGTADAVASGRIELWAGTVRAILERPFFGYGENQFRAVVTEAGGAFNHPHNSVIQVLLQWGFIGGGCFIALAAVLCWRACLEARKGGGEALPAFLVAASLLCLSLYEGSLYHPYPVMMIAVALSFLLAQGSESDPLRDS